VAHGEKRNFLNKVAAKMLYMIHHSIQLTPIFYLQCV